MTETPAPRAPLNVETDLDLTIDGVRTDVSSTGDRLFISFASLRAAGTALGGLPQVKLPELSALLAETDLTVEIRARDRTVFALGAEATAGPLSQRLGVAPAQVRLAGLVAAMGQEVLTGLKRVRNLLR